MTRAWLGLFVVSLVGCGSTTPLERLAQGSFVTPPETVSIRIRNYAPQPGGVLQNIFASNFSVKVSNGALYYSEARDGLTNDLKTNLVSDYGFGLESPESVVPGFSDLLLFRLGLKLPAQSGVQCPLGQRGSAASDGFDYTDERYGTTSFLGLRDCEKSYLYLDPALYDNAGNGVPDSLKVRCGLNPQSAADAFVSTAGDGVANIDKCKMNIPIDESAFTQPNQTYAYHYETRANPDNTTDVWITNVPVLNGGQDNFIAFMITEQNLTTHQGVISTAFTTTRSAQVGQVINIDYWGTSSTNLTNQRITVP